MSILFLDIDGVLNHRDFLQTLKKVPDCGREVWLGSMLDPVCIDRLNTVVERTGCDIVICSTWRLHHYDILPKLLAAKGFRYSDRIIGRTRSSSHNQQRGVEIKDWVDLHGVANFAILDDDGHMDPVSDRLVQTSMLGGLMDKHVTALIALIALLGEKV